jgi:hypothetical protein
MSKSKKSKERRLERHNKNIQKEKEHKISAWNNGKLIEENRNQGPYSPTYTRALTDRLCLYLNEEKEKANQVERGTIKILNKTTGLPLSPDEVFIRGFRKYKEKIIDLIIYWSPEVPQDLSYQSLKFLMEVYWDEVIEKKNPGALRKAL